MIYFGVTLLVIWLNLWVAFGKRWRPISWGSFWLNIGAAVLNLCMLARHIWMMV